MCGCLASSDLFGGCKKFKLMELPRINSRSWKFLFAVTSHARINFVQLGLLCIAEEESRDVGVCEMPFGGCVLQRGWAFLTDVSVSEHEKVSVLFTEILPSVEAKQPRKITLARSRSEQDCITSK